MVEGKPTKANRIKAKLGDLVDVYTNKLTPPPAQAAPGNVWAPNEAPANGTHTPAKSNGQPPKSAKKPALSRPSRR
jgi:hypothetical protein